MTVEYKCVGQVNSMLVTLPDANRNLEVSELKELWNSIKKVSHSMLNRCAQSNCDSVFQQLLSGT